MRLTVPATWASQAPSTWGAPTPAPGTLPIATGSFSIGLRIANLTVPAVDVSVGIRHVLFNSVSAHNALTIPVLVPEILGPSDGKPFQVFTLRNRPVFKRLNTDTPYDHVVVQVGIATWTQVDDLPAGRGNFYRLDPIAAEISFGNFDATTGKGHGSIPLAGAQIAAVYRYAAGGMSGNVGAGRISGVRIPLGHHGGHKSRLLVRSVRGGIDRRHAPPRAAGTQNPRPRRNGGRLRISD